MESYFVCDCLLTELNGEYVEHEAIKAFVHSTGEFKLVDDGEGNWLIRRARAGISLAASIEPNWDLCKLKWQCYDVHSETWVNCQRMAVRHHRRHFPDPIDREARLQEEINRLSAALASLQERERDLQRRYDALLMRLGKSHTRRDWGQNGHLPFFPMGEDIREEFQAAFLNFESFACDAINCLEDMGVGDKEAPQLFVQQIMLPLFSETKKFVRGRLNNKKALFKQTFEVEVPKEDAVNDESVPRLFWYHTQQPQFPAAMAALTNEQILELMQSADPLVIDLHRQMLKASDEGEIEVGEQNLRIPQIVRHLLRLHTVAALSDPPCYLYPAPGVTVPYQEGVHAEILSPGVRRYGKIKEGEQVEVVLPGLYFDPPEGNPRPVIRSLVRRMLCANDPVLPGSG